MDLTNVSGEAVSNLLTLSVDRRYMLGSQKKKALDGRARTTTGQSNGPLAGSHCRESSLGFCISRSGSPQGDEVAHWLLGRVESCGSPTPSGELKGSWGGSLTVRPLPRTSPSLARDRPVSGAAVSPSGIGSPLRWGFLFPRLHWRPFRVKLASFTRTSEAFTCPKH